MRRRWQGSANVRSVSRNMTGRNHAQTLRVVQLLEGARVCDCLCHTTGQRMHPPGTCKCKLKIRGLKDE